MVSSKLGVGSIERGVAVGLWFLDPGENVRCQSHSASRRLRRRHRVSKDL